MNIIYLIFASLICFLLLSFWCIDHFYMKKITNTYGKNSNELDAYKQGAIMGLAKAIIIMGGFFSIALTISAYNNAQFKSEEIIKQYFNYPELNNLKHIDTIYVEPIMHKDSVNVDSLLKNIYILHK